MTAFPINNKKGNQLVGYCAWTNLYNIDFQFLVSLLIVLYKCVKEEHINYLQIWHTKYVFNLCHHHDLLMTLPSCSFSFHANILIILNILCKLSFTSPFSISAMTWLLQKCEKRHILVANNYVFMSRP